MKSLGWKTVVGKIYTGKALGDVLTGTAAIFPDVHRDLKSITVEKITEGLSGHRPGSPCGYTAQFTR